MAAHAVQFNFNGGIFSQKLEGRADLKKYLTGVLCLRNMVAQLQGGATRRAGTILLGQSKDPTRKVRLERFVYSNSATYMLEVGHNYIRFWTQRAMLRAASSTPALTLTLSTASGPTIVATATTGAAYWTDTNTDRGREISYGGGRARILSITSTTIAVVEILMDFSGTSLSSGTWTVTGAPVEVTTTYTETELPYLRFAQSNDVMYIAHRSHAPAKLTRLTATSFTLADVAFDPPPTYESGIVVDTSTNTVTLSAATVGSGRTLTFATGVLQAADSGRTVSHGAGRGVITAVNSATSATIRIKTAFSGTSLTTGNFTVGLSPIAALVIGTTGANQGGEGETITIRAANTNTGEEQGVTSWPSDFGWPAIAAFRSTDEGKMIIGAGGVAEIETYISESEVQARVVRVFKDLIQNNVNAIQDGVPDRGPWRITAGLWTLESDTWTSARGYPGVVYFDGQRLCWAGSEAEPDKYWESVTGDYEGHAVGPNADDAFAFRLANGNANMIRWAGTVDNVMLGTLGGEFLAKGSGDNEAQTPTSVHNKVQSNIGSSDIVDCQPTEDRLVFLARGNLNLKEISYNVETNKYLPGDLSTIAENLFVGDKALTYLTFAAVPHPFLLATTSDGYLLCCTYRPAEDIRAWADFVTGPEQDLTDGLYEAVEAMPNSCGSADEIWVGVKRIVDGTTIRTIEVFDGFYNTDSSIVYSGHAVTKVRGLALYEGESVRMVGDDEYEETVTVTNGQVEADESHAVWRVGLYYENHLKTLRPVVQREAGPSIGRVLRVNDVLVVWHCSRGDVYINNELIVWPPEATFPYSGVSRHAEYGWDRDGRVTISGRSAFPMTVSCISLDVDISDGG